MIAFTALVGAAIADRNRHYKEVAGFGYGVSAATRVGLVAARNAWIPATGLLYADRAAKGVRTAPRGAEHFCWRIDVLPRLTHLAGLELSTDVNLNIVAPEDAAAVLREA